MAKALPAAHLKILESATKVALGNACKALSKMFDDEVIVEKLDFFTSNEMRGMSGDEQAMVFSKIIGDFTANTFLLLDQKAQSAVAEVLLPASMRARPEMRDAILQEVDNILVASLVTKYANLFNVSIHGHVPFLTLGDKAIISKSFSSENDKINPVIGFETEIQSFKSQVGLRLSFFSIKS